MLFLICQFLINVCNVKISLNRIHFNFNNKIKTVTTRTYPERNKTEAQSSSSQCSARVLNIKEIRKTIGVRVLLFQGLEGGS